ncbi:MAG TPA: hypothetical protein VK548_29230 [Candidatus Acidoferrum sp.]|nr:hypothetical protein [Candidatus Acidoferrum sp.]
MKRYTLPIAVLVVALTAAVAAAQQQFEIKAPTAPRGQEIEGIINPGLQYEITQPDDHRFVPLGPRVHYEPAFIEPLSTPTETGRMGVAGWTSPTAAMGGTQSGAREVTGYFAIGFAFEWGGPPPSPKARAR